MEKASRISRRNALALATAGAGTALMCALAPTRAFAVPLDQARQQARESAHQIVQAQLDLETATDAYFKASEEHDKIQGEVEETQQAVERNSMDIVELQQDLAEHMKATYRDEGLTMVDVVTESSSFSEMVSRFETLDRLNKLEARTITKTKELKKVNEAEKSKLELRKAAAKVKYEECATLRDQASNKLSQLEELQKGLNEEVSSLLEEELRASLEGIPTTIEITGANGLSPAAAVVEYARSRIGCPYVWGAEGPNAFDCSGLVMWCYAQVGISIPHYTESQYALARSRGAVLALSDVRPGDVLYRPGHVGIAITNGGTSFIHAPHSGATVCIANYAGFVCGLRFAGAVEDKEEEKREEETQQQAQEEQAEEEQAQQQQQTPEPEPEPAEDEQSQDDAAQDSSNNQQSETDQDSEQSQDQGNTDANQTDTTSTEGSDNGTRGSTSNS